MEVRADFYTYRFKLNILVLHLPMPYYRIIVWTKTRKKPYEGIRLVGNHNINAVQQMFMNEGERKFREKLIDVEVQQLSKLCTAVKEFQKQENVQKFIELK